MRTYWESSFDGFLATTMVGLTILMLLAIVWLTVKCLDCVARAFAHHPTCKPLIVAGLVALVMVVLAAVTGGHVDVINALAGVSVMLLVLVAKIVNVYYDTLFQIPLSREALVTQILHEPWLAAA